MRALLISWGLILAVGGMLVAGEVGRKPAEERVGESGDRIWTAVVLATNPAVAKEAPVELREWVPRLARIFGYRQWELIGSVTEKVDVKGESWPVPSQNFWLRVKARVADEKVSRGGYWMSLELFQDERPIFETEVKLSPGSPIFIRGPQYGQGQVVIILEVQRLKPRP
ncbi:MAG: hypothetical protein WCI46_14880 [Verrucomicrobiota bacterium]